MIKRLFSLSVWSKRGGVVRCKYVGCVHRHGCGCKWCDSWGREWPWRRQRRDDILHTRQSTSSVPTKCSWRISGARDTTSRKLWVLEPHPPVPSPHLHTHTPLPHAYYQQQSLYCLATIGMLSFVSDWDQYIPKIKKGCSWHYPRLHSKQTNAKAGNCYLTSEDEVEKIQKKRITWTNFL